MLNFLNKTSRSYLGVDIGTVSMKIVEVRGGENLPVFANYGILESESSLTRTNTAFQTSSLKIFEDEAIDFLNLLLSKANFESKVAIASIPAFSAFTTVLTFPAMSPKELESAISYQAKQYIPIPISEAALDWVKVGESEDDKGFKTVQVLLISVPQENIKKYQNIFSSVGLTLRALEVESISLVRALTQGDPTPSFILDIGSRASSILVAEKGQLKFSGQTDFGGASLTQGLSSGLNINPMRAEELKKERGIISTGPNQELSTIMLPFLDAIINEVRRVEFGYKNQFPKAAKIERLMLAGGGSNLLGIQKYFADRLGIPVVKAAPLTRFEYPKSIEPLVPELNLKFSVALGLPLREFNK